VTLKPGSILLQRGCSTPAPRLRTDASLRLAVKRPIQMQKLYLLIWPLSPFRQFARRFDLWAAECYLGARDAFAPSKIHYQRRTCCAFRWSSRRVTALSPASSTSKSPSDRFASAQERPAYRPDPRNPARGALPPRSAASALHPETTSFIEGREMVEVKELLSCTLLTTGSEAPARHDSLYK